MNNHFSYSPYTSGFFHKTTVPKACHNCHHTHIHHHTESFADTNTPVTADGFYKIVIVLDESGSMEPVRSDMIKSINSFLLEQRQIKERPAMFTLVKFNDQIKRVVQNKPFEQVQDLTSEDYSPNGSTALYDAVGDTINWFRNERDVLMVIVTDGQENASRKHTKSSVNNMIEDKKKNKNWTYVYLSNDLNTYAQGNNIGLSRSAAVSNCMVQQSNFGNFISNDLNEAVKQCRKSNQSVQSYLNK